MQPEGLVGRTRYMVSAVSSRTRTVWLFGTDRPCSCNTAREFPSSCCLNAVSFQVLVTTSVYFF
jgi:hypothetical protein